MGLCRGRHLGGNDTYARSVGFELREQGGNAGIGVDRVEANGFCKQVIAVDRLLHTVLRNTDDIAEANGERRPYHGAQLGIRHGRKPHLLHHSACAGKNAGSGFDKCTVKIEQNRWI